MRLSLWSILWVACSSEEPEASPPLAVRAEVATVASVASPILKTTVLEAEQWRPLYFQQSGLVADIAVAEGDRIEKGQRLANLDLAYQDNQVATARVQYRAAELDLERARRELTQAQTISASGGYSKEQVRDREQRVEQAELNLERARLTLRGQVIRRDQMMLHAPFDGVVSEVNLRLGDRVRGDVSDPDNDTNQRPPMAAYQPGRFTMRFSLPENQASLVQVGAHADVNLVDDPTVAFDGTIEWVAPSVDRDSRTVAVRTSARLGPDDPVYGRVRDGSTVRVAVAADRAREVLTVPEGAVVYHRDQAFLFVTDGQTVERVPITQGRIRSGRVEVEAGLQAGTRVVTTQVYRLTDGQAVRVTGEGP